MSKSKKLNVQGNEITIIENKGKEYISLTDMLKAKDGDFFISDWLRNRNTVEYLGIWESVYNPSFNYGEFAIIKSQAGLNSYKISVKEFQGVYDFSSRNIFSSINKIKQLLDSVDGQSSYTYLKILHYTYIRQCKVILQFMFGLILIN